MREAMRVSVQQEKRALREQERMTLEARHKDRAMLKMFRDSAWVEHAAASALAASKGLGPPPKPPRLPKPHPMIAQIGLGAALGTLELFGIDVPLQLYQAYGIPLMYWVPWPVEEYQRDELELSLPASSPQWGRL